MAITADTRTHIISLIDAAYKRMSATPTPYSFLSLVEAIKELPILERMFKEGAEDLFKARCKDRARLNQESFLSFVERPYGVINSLYWDIARALFSPSTMGEMLAILMPEVTDYVAAKYTLDTSVPLPHMEIVESPVGILTKAPTRKLLPYLVVAEHRVLDVRSIATFNFTVHRALHNTLMYTYPALGIRLYQHNTALKILSSRLSIMDRERSTPREAISDLLRVLKLTDLKRKFVIEPSPLEAIDIFLDYLNSLPAEFLDELMSLSHEGCSLHQIVGNLKGNVKITTEIDCLEDINNNPTNFLLTDRPYVSADYIEPYDQLEPYDQVKAERSSTHIPEIYSEDLSTLNLDSEEDCADILSTYPLIIQYAQTKVLPELITGSSPSREKFSPAQKEIFFRTLFAYYYQFNLTDLIFHYLTYGQPSKEGTTEEFVEETFEGSIDGTFEGFVVRTEEGPEERLGSMIHHIPAEAMHAALVVKDKEGRTLLHRLASKPAYFKIILALYANDEARISAMIEKNRDGYTVLHDVALRRAHLGPILDSLPESIRFTLLTTEIDNEQNTVLHYAALLHHNFADILKSLPEEELFSAVILKNSRGDTPLHRVAAMPEKLHLSLELLHSTLRLAALNQRNIQGRTVLHTASLSAESIPPTLALLDSDSERLAAISAVDNLGNTLLHILVSRGQSIKAILELIPPDNHSALLNMKNSDGNTVAHLATQHPVPEEEDSDGNIVAQDPVPELLLDTLALYPRCEQRAVLYKNKNNEEKTVFNLMDPRSAEIIHLFDYGDSSDSDESLICIEAPPLPPPQPPLPVRVEGITYASMTFDTFLTTDLPTWLRTEHAWENLSLQITDTISPYSEKIDVIKNSLKKTTTEDGQRLQIIIPIKTVGAGTGLYHLPPEYLIFKRDRTSDDVIVRQATAHELGERLAAVPADEEAAAAGAGAGPRR